MECATFKGTPSSLGIIFHLRQDDSIHAYMTNTSIEAMGHGYSWKGFWVSTRRLKETESQTRAAPPPKTNT